MCGIIGIVSRPPTRVTPDPADLIAGLGRAEAALTSVPADMVEARTEARTVDEALRGLPGVLALAGHVDVVAAITARLDQLDAATSEIERRARHQCRRTRPRGARTSERRADRPQGCRSGRFGTTGCARHARWKALAGRDAPVSRTRRVPRRTAGVLGDRSSRGARSRLGGPARLRLGSRHRRAVRWLRSSPIAVPTRCSSRAPSSTAGTVSVVRLQGGCRDRRARRQHRRPAPGAGRRHAPAPCRAVAVGSRGASSATPAGRASASSASPTRIH